MASPYQYPWVDYDLVPTPNIDSTPLIVYGATNNTIVDRMHLCNTTDQDIFVDISILTEREIDSEFVVQTTFLENKLPIPKYGSIEALKESMTLRSGDIMYASSDFSGNRFDCLMSVRRLLET